MIKKLSLSQKHLRYKLVIAFTLMSVMPWIKEAASELVSRANECLNIAINTNKKQIQGA